MTTLDLSYFSKQEAQRPEHVAIIMDGNGRWASSRYLPRFAGHRQGADAAKTIIKSCLDQHIPFLTLFAFSSENWHRPDSEVKELMGLLQYYLEKEVDQLHQQGIKVIVIGDRTKLTTLINKLIIQAEQLTKHNTRLVLTIALSYGARQEIATAARRLAELVSQGVVPLEDITESTFDKMLYTRDVPDVDLLIRTGGEQRLSNFLLWQSAYAELYFTDILWPDFNMDEFSKAMHAYQTRERRFGRVKETI